MPHQNGEGRVILTDSATLKGDLADEPVNSEYSLTSFQLQARPITGYVIDRWLVMVDGIHHG